MKYEAAIFDLDGTLVNTLDDLADSMNAVLAELSMPTHPIESYRYFVGLGMLNLAGQAAPRGTPPDTLKKMALLMGEKYGGNWDNKSRPYPGIPELLASLRSRGLKVALLSNKPDLFSRKMAERFFPNGTFDAVMGARDDVPHKPDPTGALMIADRFGVSPQAFLYLGDTNTDMQTGTGAGMFTIGVSWGFRPVEELTGAGAQAIIDRPEQALDFL